MLTARDGFSVTHVRDFVGEQTLDVDWIPLAAKEGGSVISGDRRLASREHELLALRSSGLRTFILAPGWSKLPFWEKAWLAYTMVSEAGRNCGAVLAGKHLPRTP